MKKFSRLVILILVLFTVTACGNDATGKESQEGASSTTQSSSEIERVDITAQTESFATEVETTGYKAFLGMQFLGDEPVQLWAITHVDENDTTESNTNGTKDVYLHREDGSKELLLENLAAEYVSGSCFLDRDWNLYCLTHKYFIKLSAEGEEIYRHSRDSIGARVWDICQLPDGQIYARLLEDNGSGSSEKLAELDPDTGKFTLISEVQMSSTAIRMGYGPEGLMWLDHDGVWKVNVKDGSSTCVLTFTGTSYTLGGKSAYIKSFRVTEDGQVILLLADAHGSESRVETLALQPVSQEKIPIVMRGFSFGSGWFKNQVAEFNKTNEKYYVVLEECGDDTAEEDFSRQTSVEIATGKGPDIIYGQILDDYVSGMLEKGVFADLGTFMEGSGIREEDYFPCAFSSWRDGEKIYGVNMTANLIGYRIDEAVLGSRQVPDVEVLVDALLAYQGEAVYSWNADSQAVLQMLLEGSEDLWGMIDWENGNCDFGGELFSKILQVAKRYGHDGKSEYPQLVTIRYCDSFYMYDSQAEQEEEGKVTMGTLFDDGCYANVISQWQIMAINNNSTQKEGAWEFLCFLLGEEAQANLDFEAQIPVNRKVFDSMVETELQELAAGKIKRTGSVQIVNGKWIEDNRVYRKEDITEEKVEEFIRNIEEARPLPIQTIPIQDIIFDEAQDYFDGVKGVEEVVAIIENRVNLYLEER